MTLFLYFKVSATLIISMSLTGISVAAEKQRIEKEAVFKWFETDGLIS